MRRAFLFIVAACLSAQTAQDPSDTLEQARDKFLAGVPSLPKYVCVETIDRSYFKPEFPGRLSCEELGGNSTRRLSKRKPDYTDRVRVAVGMVAGREIFSWTGPGIFSESLEKILDNGPRGTGEFGTFLLDVFSNPYVRFRVLSEKDDALEYGFRVPIESSQYIVQAGPASTEWRATGYSGSVSIDPRSLAIRRLTLATNELPPETSLCEVNYTAEYYGTNALGLLLPRTSRSVRVRRDEGARETLATFSDCHELAQSVAAGSQESIATLPEGISFEVALTSAIDTASAAAGDVISARLTRPMSLATSSKVLAPVGATMTGRIVQMQFRPAYIRISIAFDTLQVDGAFFRLHTSFAGSDNALIIRAHAGYVVPAGYKSNWLTTGEASGK